MVNCSVRWMYILARWSNNKRMDSGRLLPFFTQRNAACGVKEMSKKTDKYKQMGQDTFSINILIEDIFSLG